jgi:hypothetical protein
MGIKVKAFAIDEHNVELKDQPMIEVELTDAISAMVANGTFATDDEGLFFQRQLEYIQATSYDVLYPDLKGRELLTTNTEGGEGINAITYRSYDKRGETAIIAGKATDLPRGDISGKEYSITVKTLGNAYGYSRQEIAAAKLVGMPLDSRKAEATRRSYEEKVNQLIFFGSAENNIHGIYDGPAGAPALTANRSLLSGTAGVDMHWADKTPAAIIKDLTDAVTAMYVDTKQLFRPNEIWLSVENLQLLHNTPRSETTDTSIIQWFVQNNKFITSVDQFKDINELESIFPNATVGTIDDKIEPNAGYEGITVIANGTDNLRIREPFPYVHLPVQLKGLEFEINCYGRFAGVETIRPAAVHHFLMGAKA